MRDKFNRGVELLVDAQRTLEDMKELQKSCHKAFDPVMELVNKPSLWPKKFDEKTFILVKGDLTMVDGLVDMTKHRIDQCEAAVREIAMGIKMSELYSRLQQQPPTSKTGRTLAQEIDDNMSLIEAVVEEIPVLQDEFQRQIRDMESLAG